MACALFCVYYTSIKSWKTKPLRNKQFPEWLNLNFKNLIVSIQWNNYFAALPNSLIFEDLPFYRICTENVVMI